MSVVTAVKYNVLERYLKDWLKEMFGSEATCEVCSATRLGLKISWFRGLNSPFQGWFWERCGLLEGHCASRDHSGKSAQNLIAIHAQCIQCFWNDRPLILSPHSLQEEMDELKRKGLKKRGTIPNDGWWMERCAGKGVAIGDSGGRKINVCEIAT